MAEAGEEVEIARDGVPVVRQERSGVQELMCSLVRHAQHRTGVADGQPEIRERPCCGAGFERRPTVRIHGLPPKTLSGLHVRCGVGGEDRAQFDLD